MTQDSTELDPTLLELIVCPQCHGQLALDTSTQELACIDSTCGLVYPIRDGIPVLLIDEATRRSVDDV